MSIIKRRQKIIERLKDKAHRDAFVESLIHIGLPFQIRALRQREEWTQKQLSEQAEMKQSWISRIENPGYSGFSLKTLLRLASVFDVGLVVKFVPVSQLVESELNLSADSLRPPKFEDDPYFLEPTAEADVGVIQKPTKTKQDVVINIFADRPHGPKILDAAKGGQSQQGAFYFQQRGESRESALS